MSAYQDLGASQTLFSDIIQHFPNSFGFLNYV